MTNRPVKKRHANQRNTSKKGRSGSGVANRQPQPPKAQQPPLPFAVPGLQMVQIEQRHFSGPVPDPESLARYEAILPGSADRLIGMAEMEQAHRHEIFTNALQAGIARGTRGQYMGFGVVILFALIAAALIWHGDTVGGSILGTVDLIGLTALFVGRERSEDKKLES